MLLFWSSIANHSPWIEEGKWWPRACLFVSRQAWHTRSRRSWTRYVVEYVKFWFEDCHSNRDSSSKHHFCHLFVLNSLFGKMVYVNTNKYVPCSNMMRFWFCHFLMSSSGGKYGLKIYWKFTIICSLEDYYGRKNTSVILTFLYVMEIIRFCLHCKFELNLLWFA